MNDELVIHRPENGSQYHVLFEASGGILMLDLTEAEMILDLAVQGRTHDYGEYGLNCHARVIRRGDHELELTEVQFRQLVAFAQDAMRKKTLLARPADHPAAPPNQYL